MRSKVLYKFEGGVVFLDFAGKFLVADQIRIGHEPILPTHHDQHQH